MPVAADTSRTALESHGRSADWASIAPALEAWTGSLGQQRVLVQPHAIEPYRQNTSGVARRITAVLQVRDARQVQDVVRIARRFRIPLYPVSTGRNWGYGTANPCLDGCAVLDLSDMNRILEFDESSGVVTLEPGVTQQQLWEFLTAGDHQFCVPTHGGGPDCSLLGNALERGYGLTPHADHFAAVTSLEAILPDGSVYRSPLREMGAGLVDASFKWSIGPYLDGLFSQGNLGIVTRASIALAPRPRHVEAFFFSARSDQDLEGLVTAVQTISRRLGSLSTSINLMNRLRVLSMTAPYPQAAARPGTSLPDDVVCRLADQRGIAAWTGAGALWGEPSTVRAARRIVRQILKPWIRRCVFMDLARLNRSRTLLRLLPRKAFPGLRSQLSASAAFLNLVSGRPGRIALPLAYWKSGSTPGDNPAADGCGLRWYSPLVSMRPQAVREYVQMVASICHEHGFDPLLTLTSLSDRCFDSTVPLLYDPRDEHDRDRVMRCHRSLFDAGKLIGVVPYRVGVDQMDWIVDRTHPCWQLVQTIKQAVDPASIIAPGRYSPTGPTSRDKTPSRN